jgi:hypothetical protein
MLRRNLFGELIHWRWMIDYGKQSKELVTDETTMCLRRNRLSQQRRWHPGLQDRRQVKVPDLPRIGMGC